MDTLTVVRFANIFVIVIISTYFTRLNTKDQEQLTRWVIVKQFFARLVMGLVTIFFVDSKVLEYPTAAVVALIVLTVSANFINNCVTMDMVRARLGHRYGYRIDSVIWEIIRREWNVYLTNILLSVLLYHFYNSIALVVLVWALVVAATRALVLEDWITDFFDKRYSDLSKE